MDFAQSRFKALRVALGLSQAEIAEILGMHQTAWGRFETGKVPDPRTSTIIHVCKTFGVSSDWLLGLTEGEQPVFRVRIERNKSGKWEIVPD